MNTEDQQQRELTLNINQSFIVQAPAGSGKTSILVQRYLALLAHAKHPEEILAITFTRKAAGEMRERIVAALNKARTCNSSTSKTGNTTELKPHQALLLTLAQKVLLRDQEQHWHILENPGRLRIQTIDAFCSYLSKQMPLLADFSNAETIATDAEADSFYHAAARTLLQNLAEPTLAEPLQQLLIYLDNDIIKAENLLVEMLKRRMQWLPYVFEHHEREIMEHALQNINDEILEKVISTFPAEHISELKELLWFATNQLHQQEKLKNFSKIFQLFDFKRFFLHIKPDSTLSDVNADANSIPDEPIFWHAVTELLLTAKGDWRKSIDVKIGFPPKTAGTTKEEKQLFDSMKSQMQQFLDKISTAPNSENLRQNLEELTKAPANKYTDAEWEIICALLTILPVIAAQLTVIFNEANITDYTETAIAADRALGNSNNPTDLTLHLDYKLHHILIDEFQDTSVAQMRLIEKLIAGWQPGDGRTLFLVGDPMQSIYRFRQAEVGLFLRAKQQGISNIQLTPIALTTNFRSEPNLIAWLNQSFQRILPDQSDINYGAVNFTPALPDPEKSTSEHQNAVTVQILENANDENEAEKIVGIIQELQKKYADESIAILCRSRSHVATLLTLLKKNNIKYAAPELKALTESPIIQDLFALTRAMLHPADKVAWLAALRAPWCGLQLQDLLVITNGPAKTIFENINNQDVIAQLSQNAAKRLETFTAIINFAQKQQRNANYNTKNNVYAAWQALNGPACALNEEELENAGSYFKLLADFSAKNAASIDLKLLENTLQKLYAPTLATDKLQIMTIHKAKGLEFDHVIIPALDGSTRSNASELLLWMERPRLRERGSDLIIAPIKANSESEASIYEFLKASEHKKEQYELGRLLYVAATRAKKSLFLIGKIDTDDEKPKAAPSRNNLLKHLWPCFETNWLTTRATSANTADSTVNAENKILSLRRLKNIAPFTPSEIIETTSSFTFSFENNVSAILGTVIHKAITDLCRNNITKLNTAYLEQQKPFWQRLLLQLGCRDDLATHLQSITTALTNILDDNRGRWIIDNKHEAAQSEFAITTIATNGALQPKNFIIDRTFIARGIRWIIDYKTATPQNVEPTTFLAQQQEKYQTQLQQYAKAMRAMDIDAARQIPICLGLYFPLCKLWVEWEY